MSSYTKLTPQANPNRSSYTDFMSDSNSIKLKTIRTKKDSNLFSFNEYKSSINPFPKFNNSVK